MDLLDLVIMVCLVHNGMYSCWHNITNFEMESDNFISSDSKAQILISQNFSKRESKEEVNVVV